MADDTTPPSVSVPDSESSRQAAPPRRRVYESTLFPERRRRHFPPWLVVPLILLLCGGVVYYIQAAAHRTRFVATAGEIVYASDQGTPGRPHLWTIRFDGTGSRALTSGPAADTSPAFSPGGSQVAFLSDRDSRQNQVFLVDADGQNLIQVTRNSGAKSKPAWAPGRSGLLGFTSEGALSVLTVTSEGAGDADRLLPPPPQVPHTPGAEEASSDETLAQQTPVTVPSYAWCPAQDAGLAAVEDTGTFQALAVFATPTAAPKDVQQTAQGGLPLAAADTMSLGWSSDGSLLAVAMLGIKGTPSPASGIVLFDRDGNRQDGRPPFLAVGAADGPQNPVFSPDGTQILFEEWSQPNLASHRRLGLGLASTDGSAPPRLVYKGDASGAQLAPDGSTIFFLGGRPGGGHDLCRIAPDGSGFARLSDGRADVLGFTVSPQSPAH